MLVARILPLQEITLKLKIHFLLGKSEELVQQHSCYSAPRGVMMICFINISKPHLTMSRTKKRCIKNPPSFRNKTIHLCSEKGIGLHNVFFRLNFSHIAFDRFSLLMSQRTSRKRSRALVCLQISNCFLLLKAGCSEQAIHKKKFKTPKTYYRFFVKTQPPLFLTKFFSVTVILALNSRWYSVNPPPPPPQLTKHFLLPQREKTPRAERTFRVWASVRHVTGTGTGLLGEIPRVVVQKSALL